LEFFDDTNFIKFFVLFVHMTVHYDRSVPFVHITAAERFLKTWRTLRCM